MRRIYLDHAATTKPDSKVIQAMANVQEKFWGNPSSIHSDGQSAKQVLDESRKMMAFFLGANEEEIVFTGGGSEADNLAIKGVVDAFYSNSESRNPKSEKNSNKAVKQWDNNEAKPHVITSAFEHHAVLDTVRELEKNGSIEATYIKPDNKGLISVKDVEAAIKENTILVSIMYVNNEVGTVQPIREIGEMISRINDETRMTNDEKSNKLQPYKIYFHTDAVQAAEYFEISPQYLKVDMLSMAAHKFYGPKGVGILYVRKGTPLTHQIIGGSQERKKRAGTENVSGIRGMAVAAQQIKDQKSNIKNIVRLRDKLIDGILKNIPNTKLNGDREKRSPANANISFINAEGESIILMLDVAGVSVSSGSACTSGSLEPSHVLLSMGIPHEEAHGSIRFTLGKHNTEEEIDRVLQILPGIVQRLRDMSPIR